MRNKPYLRTVLKERIDWECVKPQYDEYDDINGDVIQLGLDINSKSKLERLHY